MEEFIYLFRGGEAPPSERSPEAMQKQMLKWNAWMEKLTREGKMKAGQPLAPNGKMVSGKAAKVTDGPFAEGKEVIGGYILLRVQNMAEAIETSKSCPILEYDGEVEIRPVQKMDA